MRLDLLLKCLCFAKSRSLAAKGIEEGRALLNGSRAKASREVKAGDVLELTSGGMKRKVRIREVPKGQVAKASANDFYDVLDEVRVVDEPW